MCELWGTLITKMQQKKSWKPECCDADLVCYMRSAIGWSPWVKIALPTSLSNWLFEAIGLPTLLYPHSPPIELKWERYVIFYAITRCLKITDKVSFNIASEASYVYILSGQKLIKNAKNGSFWRVFENLKLEVKQCYQTGHF